MIGETTLIFQSPSGLWDKIEKLFLAPLKKGLLEIHELPQDINKQANNLALH